jgi:AraC-like DNA-binding protein
MGRRFCRSGFGHSRIHFEAGMSVEITMNETNGRHAEAPVRISGQPPAADALSDVLSQVRLTGAMFLNMELSAPWLTESPPSHVLAQVLMPEAEFLIEYHLIVGGSCWIKLLDEAPVRLEAGDVVMFPHGDPHLMGSELKGEAISAQNLVTPELGLLPRRHYGGGGAITKVVCGYLALDRSVCASLFASLPRLLRVSARDGDVSDWIRSYVRLSMGGRSAERLGGASVLAKLSELLFVETIRRFVESLPPEQAGWLAGARDPFVGRALALLHSNPARPWTVESLAQQVGLSRSSLSDRFLHFIGQPPIQYLTRWRISLAAQRLRSTNKSLFAIADEVGYESEAAFNRAFKRHFGLPPAAWRKKAASPRVDAESPTPALLLIDADSGPQGSPR